MLVETRGPANARATNAKRIHAATPHSRAAAADSPASPPPAPSAPRPPPLREQLRHDFDVICAEESGSNLVVLEPKTKVDLTKQVDAHRFTFDAVFNEIDGNDRIYAATLAPLLAHVFAGGHATVFAFGQTGSGKVRGRLAAAG